MYSVGPPFLMLIMATFTDLNKHVGPEAVTACRQLLSEEASFLHCLFGIKPGMDILFFSSPDPCLRPGNLKYFPVRMDLLAIGYFPHW